MRESNSNSRKNTNSCERLRRPFIETCGEVFPDGTTINLLRSASTSRLNLLLSTAKSQKISALVEYGRHIYKPARLDPSVRAAVRLPTKFSYFASTVELFASVRDVFLRRGFPDDVVFAIPYFVFAT